MAIDSNISLIGKHPIFTGINFDDYSKALEKCELIELKKGEILLRPNEENHYLFLLLCGTLKVHIKDLNSEEGFMIGEGEFTGEISIIDGKPATAYVVAQGHCQILAIHEDLLWEQFFANKIILKNFMSMVADRFRSRNQAMQKGLEERLRYEYFQKELEYARNIQSGLVPENVSLGDKFDIQAEMNSAQKIGGDFYDVFPISGNRYCVAIGDIAGKGVPAALFMVRTITLLRAEMLRKSDLSSVIECVNHALCEDNPASMFATMIAGIIDLTTFEFEYINAGHNPIAYSSNNNNFELEPVTKGMPVGIVPDTEFEKRTIQLNNEDVLCFYTDGVTEAMNTQQEQYSTERMLKCLSDNIINSAAEISGNLREDVENFAGNAEQSDDLTTVVIKCHQVDLEN